MKTRERILECALTLFNEKGVASVSTLEIATELGISPGNLYYHFHGKEPIILELFERFRAELAPLLDPPPGLRLALDDYWLFLNLLAEHLAQYRFLFQDLGNLAGSLPKLARGVRQWLNQLKKSLAAMLAQLKAQGQLSSDTLALGQLVEQICLTLIYSLDYQRVLGNRGEVRLVVYQIMMLVTPHLDEQIRSDTERLVQGYLQV